ncbi:4F2 cell-surface antigen heavy chain-like [Galleria mellonella]|uniref:4F2 cell-surface antigen heavy chain-like n=1 Tax=Galleria mellonella TaxID=7137 RepID=A0A6J1WLD0_GALME|nr:4F2 cell-surface antigen heavy chain-like [Galleria mellonella]
MNDLPENSSNTAGSDLDTLDYLRGVKSSTCLLLPTTPSPTPLDFKHPLSEEMSERPFLPLSDDANSATLQNADTLGGDSSSSADSNSVVQDPVSAQLINNISMLDYQTLSKNVDLMMGPAEDCKLNGNLNISNRKLPDFVNWNWGIIRKVLLWVVLSALVACLGAIIAMVVTIPRVCNPDLPWYQGKVFYEIFPASFKDSNNDGIGDLKGLIKKLDYIQNLGVSAIRLNSVFEAQNYPEQYYNVTSLMNIDRSIGTIDDFKDLVTDIHKRNMSIILDLPVASMITSDTPFNSSQPYLFTNNTLVGVSDVTTTAIVYWAHIKNVDGFYLKKLDRFVDDPNFGKSLQFWKQIIGYNKIFIASEETLQKANGNSLNILLSRIDLIDIHLDLRHGINGLKNRIDEVITGSLWTKPHYPWVHWNIGNIYNERISTKHLNNTLALTVLEFVLPGTVSIFYGDEIGLGGLQEVEKDFHEHKDTHNLVMMNFSDSGKNENVGILPWNSQSLLQPRYHYIDIIKSLSKVRMSTPTIYLRAIYKDGNILKNIGIRKTEENLVVIERWYPRRNTCVFVGNLGNTSITTDLSTMFYGGTVVSGTNASLVGQTLYFDEVTFPPNSAIILKLEK